MPGILGVICLQQYITNEKLVLLTLCIVMCHDKTFHPIFSDHRVSCSAPSYHFKGSERNKGIKNRIDKYLLSKGFLFCFVLPFEKDKLNGKTF